MDEASHPYRALLTFYQGDPAQKILSLLEIDALNSHGLEAPF
jgi:hypothetical protein